jgi:G3E family GTPase
MNTQHPDQRIAVYLLTGYLGSGKTSLLKHWLQQEAFSKAALIINELGEVGLDNQVLSAASESAALVANACACCTGLPGLAEAMEDLFWARLERRIHRFDALVIETTGLADPGPIVQTLAETDLLRERYRLAGVITCLSAPTANDILSHIPEARQQVALSDVLILTKTDVMPANDLSNLHMRLLHQCADMQARTSIQYSALGSYRADQLLKDLTGADGMRSLVHDGAQVPVDHPHDHAGHHHHAHEHAHNAQAFWWTVAAGCSESTLLTQLDALRQTLGHQLLRVKGRLQTDQGARLLHMAPFDAQVQIEADTLPNAEKTGLTLIVATPLDAAQRSALSTLLGEPVL